MIPKPSQRSGNQCVSVSLKELIQLSSYAKQLALPALRPKGVQAGQHLSRLLARGMEFAESRRYQAGDDIRNIDWRVTARTGRAHTKLFSAEKERPILLAADMRSPMFFATRGVFKSVQASLLMGYMAWNAAQGGDRLGGIVFANQKISEYRPALGKKGVLPFLNGLTEYAANPSKMQIQESVALEAMMDSAVDRLRQMVSPGSLIFFVSDFRGFSSYAQHVLLQISRHSDLYLCFLYDPLEETLPINGYYPITNGSRDININTFDKLGLHEYQQRFIERRRKVSTLGELQRIRYLECRTDEDCFDVLMKCFR